MIKTKTSSSINLIKTKIHYYYYDLSNVFDRNEYKKLKTKLNKTRKLFDCISLMDRKDNRDYFNKIKELDKKGVIELETDYIFNNQWNTNNNSLNLRVFDWNEEIHPNKDIKEGYYLDINKEMLDIRENIKKCGYCGKQYYKTVEEFCLNCLDSNYLREDELFLLRLKKVNDETNRKPLTDKEKNLLLPMYLGKQVIGKEKRENKYFKDKKEDIEKTFKNRKEEIEQEYKGFKWLLNKGVRIDNIIYYDHTKTFSVGWRKLLSFNEEQKFKEVLKGFPYNIELKTQ